MHCSLFFIDQTQTPEHSTHRNTLSLHDALPIYELETKAKIYGLEGEVVTTVADAIVKAKELATENDMIFIGGSTYVVAEAI